MSSSFIIINEIEELLNDVNDNLNTNINTLSTNLTTVGTNVNAIKTNTTATTTESSNGTLSAKLSYLINRRNKIVTPSSTKLKTFTSSNSITATATYVLSNHLFESGVNSMSYSCYVKYPGTYRIYVTYSTTKVSNVITPSDCTVGKTETHNVTISVTKNGNEEVSEKTNSVTGYYDSNLSSATKTIDFFCNAGANLKITITLTSYVQSGYPCSAVAYAATHRLDVTDVSIRGIVHEINGATT